MKGNTKQAKAIGAIKDIHQQREESSRARGMLASRAKSESFAYRGGQSRSTGHEEEEDGGAGGELLRGWQTGRRLSHEATEQEPISCAVQRERTFNTTTGVQHISVTSTSPLNRSVLLRRAVEGYKPYGAGVKQSQNYFCNENGAVVSTLEFRPRRVNISSVVSDFSDCLISGRPRRRPVTSCVWVAH